MMSGPRDHSASWELCATAAAVAVKQREYQRAIGLYRQSQTMMQQALVVARKLPSASAAATARTTLQNAYADTQLAIVKCYVKLRQDDAALREVRSKQANIQSNPHSSELINCLPTTTSLICCDAWWCCSSKIFRPTTAALLPWHWRPRCTADTRRRKSTSLTDLCRLASLTHSLARS